MQWLFFSIQLITLIYSNYSFQHNVNLPLCSRSIVIHKTLTNIRDNFVCKTLNRDEFQLRGNQFKSQLPSNLIKSVVDTIVYLFKRFSNFFISIYNKILIIIQHKINLPKTVIDKERKEIDKKTSFYSDAAIDKSNKGLKSKLLEINDNKTTLKDTMKRNQDRLYAETKLKEIQILEEAKFKINGRFNTTSNVLDDDLFESTGVINGIEVGVKDKGDENFRVDSHSSVDTTVTSNCIEVVAQEETPVSNKIMDGGDSDIFVEDRTVYPIEKITAAEVITADGDIFKDHNVITNKEIAIAEVTATYGDTDTSSLSLHSTTGEESTVEAVMIDYDVADAGGDTAYDEKATAAITVEDEADIVLTSLQQNSGPMTSTDGAVSVSMAELSVLTSDESVVEVIAPDGQGIANACVDAVTRTVVEISSDGDGDIAYSNVASTEEIAVGTLITECGNEGMFTAVSDINPTEETTNAAGMTADDDTDGNTHEAVAIETDDDADISHDEVSVDVTLAIDDSNVIITTTFDGIVSDTITTFDETATQIPTVISPEGMEVTPLLDSKVQDTHYESREESFESSMLLQKVSANYWPPLKRRTTRKNTNPNAPLVAEGSDISIGRMQSEKMERKEIPTKASYWPPMKKIPYDNKAEPQSNSITLDRIETDSKVASYLLKKNKKLNMEGVTDFTARIYLESNSIKKSDTATYLTDYSTKSESPKGTSTHPESEMKRKYWPPQRSVATYSKAMDSLGMLKLINQPLPSQQPGFDFETRSNRQRFEDSMTEGWTNSLDEIQTATLQLSPFEQKKVVPITDRPETIILVSFILLVPWFVSLIEHIL